MHFSSLFHTDKSMHEHIVKSSVINYISVSSLEVFLLTYRSDGLAVWCKYNIGCTMLLGTQSRWYTITPFGTLSYHLVHYYDGTLSHHLVHYHTIWHTIMSLGTLSRWYTITPLGTLSHHLVHSHTI